MKQGQIKNKKKFWKDNRFYFMAVFLLLMVTLIVQLFIINILPIKYSIIIVVVLIILGALMGYLLYNKKVSKFNQNLGKALIVILSIVLVAGNFYIYKGGQTLQNISGANIKTDAISVIVLKDNKAENGEIDKLKSVKFGVLSAIDRDNTNKAIEDINKKVSSTISTKEYSSLFDLAKALYDKQVDAIILNEAYRGTYQDNEENTAYKNFDLETKVIYQVEIESKQTDISKNVDVTKTPFNVFISGIDTYGSVSTASRSDVNMLATVNPTTHQILLTSIPRDFYVAQSCQGGQLDKLTHAGIFGVECSVSSISGLFGTDINYYARVNFTSLINIVDALGGVNVENPTAFGTGVYNFNSGLISLNGDEALAFSRDRYHQEGGDRGRGKNQMRVIEGIIKKAISPSIITNYNGVMNAISGSFQTNMESGDITKFIQKQLNSMSGWTVVQNTVDGTGGTDWTPANGFNAYVMYPDQSTVDYAKELIKKVMNGEVVAQ